MATVQCCKQAANVYEERLRLKWIRECLVLVCEVNHLEEGKKL